MFPLNHRDKLLPVNSSSHFISLRPKVKRQASKLQNGCVFLLRPCRWIFVPENRMQSYRENGIGLFVHGAHLQGKLSLLGEASRDWGEAARKRGNWEPWNPDTGLKTCAHKQLIYLISLCFGFTPFKTGLLGLPWRSVCDIKPVAQLIKSSGSFVLWLSHGVPAKTVVVVWQRGSCLIRSVRQTEMALLLLFNRIGKWDPETLSYIPKITTLLLSR